MEQLLSAFGLSYEDLRLEEREYLNNWLAQLEGKAEMRADQVRGFIVQCKNEVAYKLSELPDDAEHKLQNIHLKARLMNYIMLEGFLTSPEQAKKELENYIDRLKQSKGR
jgi:hypothetical protein